MIVNSFNYYETVKLGGVTFRAYQPTIIHLDKCGFALETSDNKLEVLAMLNDEAIRILAYMLTFKFPIFRRLVFLFIKHFSTWGEIKEAYEIVHGIVYGYTLFKSCNLDQVSSKEIDVVGGKSLIGQIASFAEYLGFTLDEILKVPYPILLLMCADKQRVLGEDDVVKRKVSGREAMKTK